MNLNILDMLYTLIIGPLKLLMEIFYWLGFRLTNNHGLSIIILSVLLNIILLPLYNRADKIQEEENNIEKKLKPGVDHIKKTFKGDERYMILQTYYRQNNYNQFNVLKGSIPLLLEIPFFMAAYSFLSSQDSLINTSFGPISNLGAPDQLFNGINILPILMTVINIVSCLIYTKGQPLKSRIQLFLMALVFLILLYNSPSGLTFYYLLNNMFSLLKNIFKRKAKKNKKIGYYLGIGLCVLAYVYIFINRYFWRTKILIGLCAAVTAILVVIIILLNNKNNISLSIGISTANKNSYILCLLFICILTGLFIPSKVISVSPEEFVDNIRFTNPIIYIIDSLLLSIGLFMIWFNIYYCLMKQKIKTILTYLLFVFCGISFINYLFFTNDLGLISNVLVYDKIPSFSIVMHIINVLSILIISILVKFLFDKKIIKNMIVILCTTMIIISSINISNISSISNKAIAKKENSNDDLSILLSKSGKNVVFIMLDKAISSFVPYIFKEDEELIDKYSGFTYYPNTISFGSATNTSTPSLYGGYEYTPEEINKRDKELLVDKHNEALKVLPVLFNDIEYDVTIWDPPYAGYSWVPDLSIYNDYSNFNVAISEGKYDETDLNILKRNLFMYSLFRISPTLIANRIYNYGSYLSLEKGTNNDFRRWFSIIENLDDLTVMTNKKGSFVQIQNSSTHYPTLLDENYKLSEDTIEYDNNVVTKESLGGDKLILDNYEKLSYYHINMATLKELGNWFDYLKTENLYDNTRIIIVSDHGANLFLDDSYDINGCDVKIFNPLLLVKDFNGNKFSVDNSFMTLGDVTYLCINDIINDTHNPFTGNEIISKEKENETFHVFSCSVWDTNINNGNTFLDGNWYSVRDNSLTMSNWNMIEK